LQLRVSLGPHGGGRRRRGMPDLWRQGMGAGKRLATAAPAAPCKVMHPLLRWGGLRPAGPD